MGDDEEKYLRQVSDRALIGRMLRYIWRFRRRASLLIE